MEKRFSIEWTRSNQKWRTFLRKIAFVKGKHILFIKHKEGNKPLAKAKSLCTNNSTMSLEQVVSSSIKEAMKAKDKATLRGLRAIKSAILLAKTDGSGDDLNAEKEIKLLQKLVKQRKDSLNIFVEQGREDLAVKEREEISTIEKFLPEQMGEEELKGILQGIIDQTGASSIKDMGKVMGMASKQLAGKADGKTISALVKQLLG